MAEGTLMLSVVLAVVMGGVILLWVRHLRVGWRGPSKSGARLPDGSLGWPVIGETLSLIRSPETYFFDQSKRYGKIFKSSLFQQPKIVGMTPEFAKFVLRNNTDFVPGVPLNVRKVHGRRSLLLLDGAEHKAVKRIFQKPMLPEGLRTKIVMDISMWILFGVRDIRKTPEGRKGLGSMQQLRSCLKYVPRNYPGSAYSKASKAKIAMTEYFRHLIDNSQAAAHTESSVLGELLRSQEDARVQQEITDFDEENLLI